MLDFCLKGFNNSFSSAEILSLDPTQLCSYFEFDSLLPPGRLNGFVNMMRLIQSQLRKSTANLPPALYKTEQRYEDDELALLSRRDEIAVLLSGGVDSSVALKLLQLQGEKVRAYYLKIWLEDEVAHLNQCPWEEGIY